MIRNDDAIQQMAASVCNSTQPYGFSKETGHTYTSIMCIYHLRLSSVCSTHISCIYFCVLEGDNNIHVAHGDSSLIHKLLISPYAMLEVLNPPLDGAPSRHHSPSSTCAVFWRRSAAEGGSRFHLLVRVLMCLILLCLSGMSLSMNTTHRRT